jgi:hypothetical protein
MPKRAVWKDKGGKSRYVLHDDPPPAEVKPIGLETVAKEALTDAVITSGAAALAFLDAMTATRRRFDRQLSNRRIGGQQASTTSEESEESDGSNSAEGRRGQLRRGKTLDCGRSIISRLQPSPERTLMKAPAA